jgi:signal transduction histidine kinase
MQTKTYRWILYGIAVVILVTIAIQVYWNYKNYLVNKQQLFNDVQVSLDKAVDDYYAQLAEKSTVGLTLSGDSQKTALDEGGLLDQLAQKIDSNQSTFITMDSLNVSNINEVQIFRGLQADSLNKVRTLTHISTDSFQSYMKELKQPTILKSKPDFELLTSKIVISISNDTLEIAQVDSLFIAELARKSIDIDHELMFYSKDDRYAYLKQNKQWPEVELPKQRKEELVTESKSTFLPDQSVLLVSFSNTTKTILGRILSGIIISFMLVLAVIASLFYLLKVIQNQKQMAEIKNDLISNITHEFKTPIATIGVALEGIQNFDVLDDKEKTRSYLNVSSQQLEKLNLMVEKLLETASLDSNSLELDKSAEDLVALMNAITDRFTHQTEGKQFTFKTNIEQFLMEIDAFHFENAINNIVDNAVKYGGHEIAIVLEVSATDLSISITDNGPGIPSEHQKRIFDQFYRVPKGNTHDVKGFGIGLYYTQNIIQRHGGTITLESKPGTTQFKIHFNHVNH